MRSTMLTQGGTGGAESQLLLPSFMETRHEQRTFASGPGPPEPAAGRAGVQCVPKVAQVVPESRNLGLILILGCELPFAL